MRIGVVSFVLMGLLVGALGLATVQESAEAARLPAAQQAKPFRLPFAMPPGPDTWLMGQPYGNTTGAYRQRNTIYVRGQGIHFGLDLSAPCGTEIVAIGEGVVAVVDDLRFGSAPHNLIIQHPNGYASLYGHLLEPPRLRVGQAVKAGEVVALSGDPDLNCRSRPHLHLEIRNQELYRAFNIHRLIDADWDNLALISGFGRAFERDLDNPHKWQSWEDQPDIVFSYPLLNDFPNGWPPSRGNEQ